MQIFESFTSTLSSPDYDIKVTVPDYFRCRLKFSVPIKYLDVTVEDHDVLYINSEDSYVWEFVTNAQGEAQVGIAGIIDLSNNELSTISFSVEFPRHSVSRLEVNDRIITQEAVPYESFENALETEIMTHIERKMP